MIARIRASARTTARIRSEIRGSTDSLRVLARRYGINPKTVAKWKKRESVDDLPAGPKSSRHRKLTPEEEEIIVRFREHTLLPLDDCLYALQAQIPHLRRSSLHRCLQRHGISNLAGLAEADERGTDVRTGPLGCLHIDRSEVQSRDGTHYLFNAIDQASKFVFVRMGSKGGAAEAVAFVSALVAHMPFRISEILTLGVEPFVSIDGKSEFADACGRLGIEHRTVTSPHPWTKRRGAPVGRMIQEVITFGSGADLALLLQEFVHAYDFRRRLKKLGGRTPYDFICQRWQQQPELFLRDPHHEMLGLEIIPG